MAKRMILLYSSLIFMFMSFAFLFVFYNPYNGIRNTSKAWNQMDEGLRGTLEEKYVMVTFLSGMEYWKKSIKGFEDGAQALNVSAQYVGATQYDVEEQVTVLEQVIAKKPAGIALSVINVEALTDSINKAVDAGIPVVLFDAGAEGSRAYSLLATNNYNAGVTAAHKMAELLHSQGKVGVITQPNQLNHQERTAGFEETIANEYSSMEVVAVKDGKGDELISAQVANDILTEHPDLAGLFVTEANGSLGVGQRYQFQKNVKIITFDTDIGTLDLVKKDAVAATIAQGNWNMGYWSLQFLFQLHHSLNDQYGVMALEGAPVPVYVDTGITVVTKDNVDNFYAK